MKWSVWIMTMLLSSCSIWKEKSRLKVDSLYRMQSMEESRMLQQWRSAEFQFKEGNLTQELLIQADAPFHWQPDSGLSGQAGTYHIALRHSGSSLQKKIQLADQEAVIKKLQQRKESLKTVKHRKNVSVLSPRIWLCCGVLILILVVWRVGKWRQFLV